MKAPRNRISKAIADRTLKGGSDKKLAQEVAAYLLAERRTHELNSVLRDVQADWAEAGHVEVVASSAYPLTAAVKADINKQISKLFPNARTITVNEENDPEVIGGVRLSLANQQLDLSVEAKLNKFKQLTLSGKE
jgi:F0F1-type ATP synthase delta subunit